MNKCLNFIVLIAALLGTSNIVLADNLDKNIKANSKDVPKFSEQKVLENFAPEFAHYQEGILLGDHWNDEGLDLKSRSLITVVSLMSQGIFDSSIRYHLENAKKNGVTKKEITAVITHVAFYAGWPKAWAVFNVAKNVWNDSAEEELESELEEYQKTIFFPIGKPNNISAKHSIGRSYKAPVSGEQLPVNNVTYEPGARNNWHIHQAKNGGGKMLIGVGGKGYYQQEGLDPIVINPGTVVNVPVGVKHWHGAAPDSWFSHLVIEIPGEMIKTEWFEPVSDEVYDQLK